MITGSCLCGTVSWQAESVSESMTHCHCSMCRKAHGAPFATYVGTPRDGFRWLSGEEAISHYESSSAFPRAFCGTCGSVVPETAGKDRIAMPAGCLNEDPGVRPAAHIFAPSEASWHIIADDLPQHDAYTRPDDGPNVERPGEGRAKTVCCAAVVFVAMSPMR